MTPSKLQSQWVWRAPALFEAQPGGGKGAYSILTKTHKAVVGTLTSLPGPG